MIDFDKVTNAPLFGVYARPVTYSPSNKLVKPAEPLLGIFDRAHEIVLDEMANSELRQAGHSTTVPVLTVRLADFVTLPAQNDQLTIAGEAFRVWSVQPDGEGCADLILRKV
ncbi:unnamed protein product [Phaeothamnion confervicola]